MLLRLRYHLHFCLEEKYSLMQRSVMQEAISAPKVGGIVRLTGFVLKGTFLVEFTASIIMMPVFVKDFGAKGIWMAIFHSISAFCNAGFDLMGTENAKYASLTSYISHPLINITIMLLIIIGGIGFLTWEDILKNKYRIKNYRMQNQSNTYYFLAFNSVSGILLFLPGLCRYANAGKNI